MQRVRIPQVSDITQKTVLVRIDGNVPLNKNSDTGVWEVSDTTRLQRAARTIQFLHDNNAKIVLISHLGRPKGKKIADLSLEPVAQALEKILRISVGFVTDCIGYTAERAVQNLKFGEVLLLENTRFHEEEEINNVAFSRKLAELADVFINEAFSVSHRSHASVVGVADFLPAFAGFQFRDEVDHLSRLTENPARPFVMVVGGRKISDKIDAVLRLTELADVVLLGGGVANTFLKAEGHDVFASYVEESDGLSTGGKEKSYVQVAADMLHTTKLDRVLFDEYIPLPKILYPTDVVLGKTPEEKESKTLELLSGYQTQSRHYAGKMILDIGPKTSNLYTQLILKAATVFWNGPMGVFENPVFAEGTRTVAKAIANASATTILGGGDTVAAVHAFGYEDRYDYVSAAGGAALEFLAGKVLPGMEPLLDA